LRLFVAQAVDKRVIFRVGTGSAAPGGQRLSGAADNCIATEWQRNLLDGLIADAPFETTSAPARCGVALDDEEGDARRERRGTVDERFQYFGLRFLLGDLGDGRLDDGHVARSFGARRLGRREFDASFVSGVQVLGDGSDEAAFHLHVSLAVKKSRK
jgi:hypothetical protein